MQTKTVQSIMHKKPISVECQTSLQQIINTIVASQQQQLPVINKQNKLIGMVSMMDCQKALLIGAYHCDQPIKVNDIMAKEYMSLEAQASLSEIATKTQHQVESTFPVTESGKLVGVVHRADLLSYLHENFSQCTGIM